MHQEGQLLVKIGHTRAQRKHLEELETALLQELANRLLIAKQTHLYRTFPLLLQLTFTPDAKALHVEFINGVHLLHHAHVNNVLLVHSDDVYEWLDSFSVRDPSYVYPGNQAVTRALHVWRYIESKLNELFPQAIVQECELLLQNEATISKEYNKH